jgi:hypothetical protein
MIEAASGADKSETNAKNRAGTVEIRSANDDNERSRTVISEARRR